MTGLNRGVSFVDNLLRGRLVVIRFGLGFEKLRMVFFHVRVNDIVDDGGGTGAAEANVFSEDGDGDLRLVGGREADEPAMVSLIERALGAIVVNFIRGKGPHLGGSGFT